MMTDFLDICIADIRFAISCQDAVLQELDSSYQSFCGSSSEAGGRIDINIYPELPAFFDVEKLEKVFDTERTWSMFRKGRDYFIAINPSAPDMSPFCVVKFDSSLREALIYCDDHGDIINGRKEIIHPFSYPVDRLLMMYILAMKQGAIIHSACIEINKRAYIFAGVSGSGKSTISRLFVSLRGQAVLSDERIAVRKINGNDKAYGTPWPGDAGMAVNRGLPLSGIFFINHGTANKIKEIKRGEALRRLLPVTLIPWYDPEIMTKILLYYEELLLRIPAYEMHFKPDVGVVDFLEEFTTR